MTNWPDLVTFHIQNTSLYRLRPFFHPCRPFCTPLSTFFCPLVDLFSVDFSRNQSEALKKPTFFCQPTLKCFKITYILFNSDATQKIYSSDRSDAHSAVYGRWKGPKMAIFDGVSLDHPPFFHGISIEKRLVFGLLLGHRGA